MTTRCEYDRCAQGPDGYVFDEAFGTISLDPMTDEERLEVFEPVST